VFSFVFNSWFNYNHELNTKSINVTHILCLNPTKLFLFTTIFCPKATQNFETKTIFGVQIIVQSNHALRIVIGTYKGPNQLSKDNFVKQFNAMCLRYLCTGTDTKVPQKSAKSIP